MVLISRPPEAALGKGFMRGLHLLGEWQACPPEFDALHHAEPLRALCRHVVEDAGLAVVGERFHQFQPQGVTGALLLAESHLAVHTWPEIGAVTADLYVCNFSRDNGDRARRAFAALREAFRPQRATEREIARGDEAPPDAELLREWLNPDLGFFLRAGRRLAKQRTAFQELEVWDTPALGKLFRLDGSFMSSEQDEFFYHENIVHLPAICHPEPKRALVIGGGDGGSADELLKHPSIERVTVVEIDAAVIAMARAHLGAIHHGALDDPRVELRVEDGLAYVRRDRQHYDLIVLDLTDPGGPSAPLYTPEFYSACAARLNPGGALSLHIGAPFVQPRRFAQSLVDLGSSFRCVRPFLVAVPLYGALWGFACASQTLDPRALAVAEVASRLSARGIAGLRYYNAETHAAMLALPGFVRELLPAHAREADRGSA